MLKDVQKAIRDFNFVSFDTYFKNQLKVLWPQKTNQIPHG